MNLYNKQKVFGLSILGDITIYSILRSYSEQNE